MQLPQVTISGDAHKIGHQHGAQAREAVHRTIAFYRSLFLETTGKTWTEVTTIASKFVPFISANFPEYMTEMSGLAEGAGVEVLDVVAVNVRTEINFGLFGDGCTALGWRMEGGGGTLLAQNWDWMEEQKANLILLTVKKEGKPRIKMVTEAGLIGKIGMNEKGVGVCLNAVRKRGMSTTKLPCHLALRKVLESESREQALKELEKWGVASACHMLIADETGAVGFEWDSEKGRRLGMDEKGRVFHSNHYLHDDLKGSDTSWLPDSQFRVKKIQELCDSVNVPKIESLQSLFKDESNYPGAICRKQEGDSSSATLFNIVMDLETRRAKVIFGRPVEPDEELDVSFK